MKKSIVSALLFIFLVSVMLFTGCDSATDIPKDTVAECTHTYGKWIEEVSADCKNDGVKGHYHCNGCGKDFDQNHEVLESLKLSATDHDFGEWVNAEEKTCTKDGNVKYRQCKNCEKYFDENGNEIADPILHHEGHSYEWVAETPAECEKEGTKGHYHCNKCGNDFDTDKNITNDLTVPATKHTYGKWIEEVSADCKNDGVKGHYHCDSCGKDFDQNHEELESLKLSATDHDFGEWVNAEEKTCTKDGNVKYRQCKNCEKYFDENGNEIADPILHHEGHSYEWIAETPAECEKDGVKGHYHCNKCGSDFDADKNVIKDLKIPATKHTYGKWIEEVSADCKNDGVKGHYHCDSCGKDFDQNHEVLGDLAISAGEHRYVNGSCTGCGAKEASEGLKYTMNSDRQSYSVSGIGTCSDIDIVIPSSYKGLPVTAIYEDAFSRYTALLSIVIPDSVTSIGSDAFYGCTGLTSVMIGDGVTSIGSSAFNGCSSLTSITIPDGATSIGNDAFNGCYKLVEVINKSSLDIKVGSKDYGYIGYWAKEVHNGTSKIVNKNEYLFYTYNNVNYLLGYVGNNTSLTLLKDYNGENYQIYDYAFYNCSSLTRVTIPNGVTSIGIAAFYGCTSLNAVYISSIEAWYGISFAGYSSNPLYYAHNLYLNGTLITELIIPDSVTSIGKYAFYGCTSLTSVKIHDSVTSIGEFAFYGCSSLTSITIPNSITSIGSFAFRGCSSLESITLPFVGATKDGTDNTHFGYIFGASSYGYNSKYVPTSLKTVVITGGTSIGSSAFYNCSNLTSVTIGSGVTSIGDDAFYGCTGLTSITVAEGNTAYHSAGNCLIETASKTLILGFKNSVIPNDGSVTSIGNNAFYGCTGLTSITIPDSVTSIGNNAFYGCTGLTSITIPDSVTSIGDYAFVGCTGLTSITIPDSVTSIGNDAFSGCSSLESITIPFVGATKDGTNNTHFGYIFGASSYSNNSYHVPTSLTTVVITGGTSIDAYAFRDCTNLASVTIGKNVESIDKNAFSNCYRIVEIINKSSLTITAGSWNYWYLGGNTIEVHDGTSKIVNKDGYLFYTYNNVNYLCGYVGDDISLTLPENYEGGKYEIHMSAFYMRRDIVSVTIPDSVTSIGYNAFQFCSSLTSITIPNSVTRIDTYAFRSCSSLTSVKFANTSGWGVYSSSTETSGTVVDVTDTSQNATYLSSTYYNYYWKRS